MNVFTAFLFGMHEGYLVENNDSNMFTNISFSSQQTAAESGINVQWLLLQLKIFLAIFGVICNTFVVVGLNEKSKKIRSPDILLLNLTMWDTVFLSSRASQHIVQALFAQCAQQNICGEMYLAHLMLNYLARTSFITSMLSTIPIAVERCLYSFLPIKVTSYNNKRRTRIIILIVVLLSLVVSTPEIMTVVCLYHIYPDNNFTSNTDKSWSLCTLTSFDNVVRSGVLLRLTFKILAWIILLALDSILIYRLLLGARMARRMYDDVRGQLNHPRSYNERSLTIAVVALVLMALVAYPVTGLVWALTYKSSGWSSLLDPRMTPEIQEAGQIVQLIYASSNLFFLLMFGTRFRRNLVNRLYPCVVGCRQRSGFQI